MKPRYEMQNWAEVGPVVIDTKTSQPLKEGGQVRVYPHRAAAKQEVDRREGVRAADRAGAGARKVLRGRRG